MTRSDQSPWELVKPHATRPLLPATTIGAPGRVTPMRRCSSPQPSCPGQTSMARYHVLGIAIPRCMSLATIALPWPVREPATAQLLLPTSEAASRTSASAPSFDAATAPSNPNVDSGIGGVEKAWPSTGASHSVPGGARNEASSGPRRSSSRPMSESRRPVASLRTKYMA